MRSGRFQKQMLSDQTLNAGLNELAEFFSKLQNLWQQKVIDDAAFAGMYLIYFAWFRNSRMWLIADQSYVPQNQSHQIPQELLAIVPQAIAKKLIAAGTFLDFFKQYRLRSVPHNARVVIQHWLEGKWILQTLTQEAEPLRLLEDQSQGKRLVTLFTDREHLLQKNHGRDAFSFALHDLMHAYEFFHHDQSRASQIGLYRLFLKAHRHGLFDEILNSPAQEALTYVFSDLNAYALHMFRAFKGVVRKYYEDTGKTKDQFELFIRKLLSLWNIPAIYHENLLMMNSEQPLKAQEERPLLDFFIECGQK